MKQRLIQLTVCFIYFICGGVFVTLWQHHANKGQMLEQEVVMNRVTFLHAYFYENEWRILRMANKQFCDGEHRTERDALT